MSSPSLPVGSTPGFRYWCRLQHPDGSFDEAYPFERSLAATSFTSFYVAEALKLAGSGLSETTDAAVRVALERAGTGCAGTTRAMGFFNHLAAAAAALQHVALLTGNASSRRAQPVLHEEDP